MQFRIRSIRWPYLITGGGVVIVAGLWLVLFLYFPNFTVRIDGVSIEIPRLRIETKTPTAPMPVPGGTVLFSDPLNGADRIVTNEYVYWNKNSACPYASSKWEMTSGTLLVKDGTGYSGVPTRETRSACESAGANDSSVFRLVTKDKSFNNSVVSMDYKLAQHGGGGVANTSYDGVHMWVGYQSQYALYAVTIARWDGVLLIKKKVPEEVARCANPSNDGCYYALGPEVKRPDLAAPGSWHHAEVSVKDMSNGIVRLVLAIDGKVVQQVDDKMSHGPAYSAGGAGVRGDNTEFYFKNFVVTKL